MASALVSRGAVALCSLCVWVGFSSAAEGADPLLSGKTAGAYYGVIDGEGSAPSGSVRVVLNRSGRGTASVNLDGQPKHAFPVRVNEAGTLLPLGNIPQSASLSGKIDRSSEAADGFDALITSGGASIPVRMVSARAAVTTPLSGLYTLVIRNTFTTIPLQQGVVGFGVLAVSKFGVIRFSGKLADNSSFSQATALTAMSQWLLVSRARTGSRIAGVIDFTPTASADFSGTPALRVHVPGPIATQPPAVPVSFVGSRFNPALGFAGTQFRFRAATGFSLDDDTTVFLGNFVKLTSTGADNVRLTLTPLSGVISGTFRANSGLLLNTSGVVFQKTNQGFGLTKQRMIASGRAEDSPRAVVVGGIPFTGQFTLGMGNAAAATASQ